MKKILVQYNGWGEQWLLGTLAHSGSELLFEYSAEALRQGLELSAPHLKLRPQAYGGFPAHQQYLPGLIADALPDGWGLLLMDRLFRKNGVNVTTLSPLDRLAFMGSRALGALTFEPADPLSLLTQEVKLLELAQGSRAVLAGQDTALLRELALLGGSPHGARPKVLVHFHPQNGVMSTAIFPGSQPWLIKFQAQDENKEACALEEIYAQLARRCGLFLTATRHFDLDKKLAGFGIARFDFEDGLRVPVHSLAGVLNANFRLPSAVDYTTFLRVTRSLTRDEREVQKAFERAVFNVVFNNRDDHSKNFAFRMGRDRRWYLAPGYDLTFCEGPGGEHQMDVCGEGRSITRAHLLELARQGGVNGDWAKETIDRIAGQGGQFKTLADAWEIRSATLQHIARVIEGNRKRLA